MGLKVKSRLILSIIGGLWLAWEAISPAGHAILRALDNREIVSTHFSPDQRHVAISVLTIGSFGAAATWCEIAVYVKQKQTSVAELYGDVDLAYTAGCAPTDDNNPIEIIKWLSPSVLMIQFQPDAVGTARLFNYVQNGTVRVTYDLKHRYTGTR